jgi:hypothetical protein
MELVVLVLMEQTVLARAVVPVELVELVVLLAPSEMAVMAVMEVTAQVLLA